MSYLVLLERFFSFYNFRVLQVSGNLTFEPLPETLTEIPLDDDDIDFSPAIATNTVPNVVTTEPYATSQLEVSVVSNEMLFPEDMFER